MVEITYDINFFFNRDSDTVYIYGAGKCGYWTGYYMNLCGYSWNGYLDSNILHEEAMMQGKSVRRLKDVQFNTDGETKIIVAVNDYRSVICDLVQQTEGANLLVYIPLISAPYSDERAFCIDFFLSYFRKQIFTKKMPLIICNSCIGSIFYASMGQISLSPFSNVAIKSSDFVKICANLEYYLSQPLKNIGWRREYVAIADLAKEYGREYLCGDLGDALLIFFHDTDPAMVAKRWEFSVKKMQYDDLLFILSDSVDHISEKTLRDFEELPGRKMVMTCREVINSKKCMSRHLPQLLCYFWDTPFDCLFDIEDLFGKMD
ncbi:DUF1919 domain-containing protein [Butyrivibrio sp. VCD2006]|uniref:DUF1919 domain-containing protein n=1 Tax=Butyrivibrio sp. VCD2006 TaxID=1280664 RepID=UPI0004050414|nr:DUF1919 domain-containing protein [Butyrivibrio sp. VCD2006]